MNLDMTEKLELREFNLAQNFTDLEEQARFAEIIAKRDEFLALILK